MQILCNMVIGQHEDLKRSHAVIIFNLIETRVVYLAHAIEAIV